VERHGIILYHLGPLFPAFDIFVPKELEDAFSWLKEDLYEARECPFVAKFLKLYEDYIYMGSEDLGHIPSFNIPLITLCSELSEKHGFKVIYAIHPEDLEG